MKSIQSIRRDFPVVNKKIFLASCQVAPVPKSVAAAVAKYFDARLNGERDDLDKLVLATRKEASKLLNSKPKEIAFMRGTTEGVAVVASMMDFKRGENVILNDLEFTTNVYPWMRMAKAKECKIKCVKTKNEKITAADIQKLIDKKTRLIAISHVQKSNGFRCELEKIGELADKKGILLSVDAVQSLGALEIDVKKTKISFLQAGGHKWLMGPSGIGLLYVNEKLLEKFEPTSVGPWQEDIDLTKPDFSYKQYKLSRSAKRFEFGGHPNVGGLMGLNAALKYINTLGKKDIDQRCRKLNDFVITKLEKAGLKLPPWIKERKYRSSYVGIKTRVSPFNIFVKAKEKGINFATSKTGIGERLRIATHIFNTEEEVEKAVSLLKKINAK